MRTDEFDSPSLIRALPHESYDRDRFNELLYMADEYNSIIEQQCRVTYVKGREKTFLNAKSKWAKVRLKELHALMYDNLMPVFRWQVRKKITLYAQYYDDIFSLLFFNLTYYGFRKLAWYIGVCSAKYGNGIKYERMNRYIANWIYLAYRRAAYEDIVWTRRENDVLMYLDEFFNFPSCEGAAITKEMRNDFVDTLFTVPDDIRVSKDSYFKALKIILCKLTRKRCTITVSKFELDYTLYYLRKNIIKTKLTIDDLFYSKTESEMTLFDMIMERLNKYGKSCKAPNY